jgi:hypothetical protein
MLAICGLAMLVSTPLTSAQRVSAELEASQISIVNDVAEATFKVVVTNEESTPIAQAWLVFADGYEVSVGDVPAEGSTASEPTTRTFDLSGHIRSLNVPFEATLKYSADGNAVEQATTVVLRLDQ